MYRDIPEDLRQLIEPVVVDHGLELVDVEVQRGPRPGLRVTVDQPTGDGRVTVDACAVLSRELETHLDAGGLMDSGARAADEGGAYDLEVSSPGLDRMLAREKDFGREVGAEIRLSTRRPISGRKRFRGTLTAFDGEVVTVVVDGESFGVPFREIERANRMYEFGPADFRSGGGGKKGGGGRGPRKRQRQRD